MGRLFVKECPWGQHPWREGRQREWTKGEVRARQTRSLRLHYHSRCTTTVTLGGALELEWHVRAVPNGVKCQPLQPCGKQSLEMSGLRKQCVPGQSSSVQERPSLNRLTAEGSLLLLIEQERHQRTSTGWSTSVRVLPLLPLESARQERLEPEKHRWALVALGAHWASAQWLRLLSCSQETYLFSSPVILKRKGKPTK